MKRGTALSRLAYALLCAVLFFSAPGSLLTCTAGESDDVESVVSLTVGESGAEESVVSLTAEEQAFVDSGREVVIGCPVGTCPLLFADEETGEIKGISVDIFDLLSETTGLRLRYEALPSGSVDYQLLEELQVDLVASVEMHDLNREAKGIVMTEPYLQTEKVFVCKKGEVLNPEEERVIALVTGSPTLPRIIQTIYPNFRTVIYDSTEKSLAAVLNGEADAVLQNQYTLQRLLSRPIYEDLQVVEAAAIGDYHCLAAVVSIGEDGQNVLSDEEEMILSILNKGIKSLEEEKVNFIIIKETAENVYHLNMEDFLYRYRYAIVLIAVSLILILFLVGQLISLARKHEEQRAAAQRAKELTVINEQMREQQQLLEEALVRAEAGNQAKSRFLFNMSHDIRTPMNAILGFSTLAKDHQYDADKMQDMLEKIHGSASTLMRLLNNVLNMSRIESGEVTVTESPCDLVEVVEKVRDILRAEMDKKRLTFKLDTVDMKNRNVYCDSLHLDHILLHLTSNAVKFSREEGVILISLHQDETDAEGKTAYRIHVKDNGIGMSEEFRQHVFEAFERERTSTISGVQGTGLGLSIVRGLVDLMGGTIELTSKLHEGTECILCFKFRQQEPDGVERQENAMGQKASPVEAPTEETVQEESGAEPAPEEDASDSPAKIDFSGKRLLLVEDNELNAEIAESILNEVGFAVEVAENGKVAFEMVRDSEPGYYDMVLMDIQMPVMDGYQSTREIRALDREEHAQIPIIALTANAFEEDRREAMASGMNGHVAKPIDVEALLSTLMKVFTEKSA